MSRKTQSPFELFSIDYLLTEEERAIRDVVRDYVDTRIKPDIADWFYAPAWQQTDAPQLCWHSV